MMPGEEQPGAVLVEEASASQETDHLVPEELLGGRGADVRHGHPLAGAGPAAASDERVDVGGILRAEIATLRPEAQEKAMEIITSWMEEGIKQGLEQGLERGRRSEASLVVRLLERRLGAIAEERVVQVRALSQPLLEELAEALLDFSAASDLDAWLEARQAPGEGPSAS
jgi:hypothetical protein